jgi:hypothetical protein
MVTETVNGMPAAMFGKAARKHQPGELRTVNGVEQIWEPCQRCNGTGNFPSPVEGGRCFACPRDARNNTLGGSWVDVADFERRKHNRELAAARRERKAREFAEKLPALIEAFLAEHPQLVMLTKLADYSGVLGDMRRTLETRGMLSQSQVDYATKLVARELADAETAAYREAGRRAEVSEPLGEVGERITIEGVITWFKHDVYAVTPWKDAYSTVMIIKTDRGAARWKASSTLDIEVGQTIKIKATVKDLTVNDSSRITTVVTRGKILD